MDEFELIRKYFIREELSSSISCIVGIGDDCALIEVPDTMLLAQSLDTLVEGVHFPVGCDPELLGYRALAVNLSDLAAMGATPHSFTLGLTLPTADELWLKSFSNGLSAMAQQVDIPLIGGDTTRGPLTLSIQVQGLLQKENVLKRSGAQVGDQIYVSGYLGDAAAALTFVLKQWTPSITTDLHIKQLLNRYYKPSPRLKLGQWLATHGATAALDISDGLIGDLQHILRASHVGAVIDPDSLPLSEALLHTCDKQQAQKKALTGGDDYELCFTWPADKELILPTAMTCHVSCIGTVTQECTLINSQTGLAVPLRAYTHF
ncbi:MAG: thiamine-phosphate kinase [Endozoicomonas sp. (ex Botrylloides leachii)]|nr:thiamine-phosphate kinase [Endozoicomonas sp. (ex Botrylloides leachii)]